MVVVGADLLHHVPILVPKGDLHGAGTVLLVEEGLDLPEGSLAAVEPGSAVVPDDVGQGGLFHAPFQAVQVEEALVHVRMLGPLRPRQQAVQLHGHLQGVDHDALGGAGVHVPAMDGHLGGAGVEVLELDLPRLAPVHGVSKVAAEALHVEAVGTVADLLVGGEGHADEAVGDIALLEPLHQGHDLRHARLVVAAQNGGAVGGDEGLALQLQEAGEILGGQDAAGIPQGDVAAVVVVDQRGFHVLPGEVGDGVHVGDEAQPGLVLVAGSGGQGAVDVAFVADPGVLDAQFLKLLDQEPSEVELALRGGVLHKLLAAGGMDPGVGDESFVGAHGVLLI